MKRFDAYILYRLVSIFCFFSLVLSFIYWSNRSVRTLDLLLGDGKTIGIFINLTLLSLPNIILAIFYISYLRNFIYIFNLILILSAFSFIYIYQIKNIKFIIIIPFLLISIFYNLNIIFDKKNLISKENVMYQIYFENKGDVGNKIDFIKNLILNKKIEI